MMDVPDRVKFSILRFSFIRARYIADAFFYFLANRLFDVDIDLVEHLQCVGCEICGIEAIDREEIIQYCEEFRETVERAISKLPQDQILMDLPSRGEKREHWDRTEHSTVNIEKAMRYMVNSFDRYLVSIEIDEDVNYQDQSFRSEAQLDEPLMSDF